LESKKIKGQLKGALKKTKNLYKKHSGDVAVEEMPADISKVLEDLFRQVDKNEGDFIKEINILRDKFISDSETIKMGLTQLLNSEEHRETISSEKATYLKQIADSSLEQKDSELDDLSKLQAREKYLGELEKEIIGILSQRFRK
jgi:Arc/MetJ-type ribon-helix-helix transcriptional regulator